MWNTLKRIGEVLGILTIPRLRERHVVRLSKALDKAVNELADKAFYVREFAAVSAERDALRERASVPVKVRWIVTAESAWEVYKKHKYMHNAYDSMQHAMDYLATHAVIDAPAGVPSGAPLSTIQRMAENQGYATEPPTIQTPLPSTIEALNFDPPADDQVEALARVLEDATAEGFEEEHKTYMRRLARVAIAHLAKRPHGLPTAEELHHSGLEGWHKIWQAGREREFDREIWFADYYLTALRPWLRDPVGCELDVHPDQLELYKWVTEQDGGYAYAAQQAIDLCRSRIRPVYECKECAKKDTRIDMYDRQQNMMAKSIEVQRQGLERAAAAARAALEG